MPTISTPVRSGLKRAEPAVQGLAHSGQVRVCLVRSTPWRRPRPGQPHHSWLGTPQPGEALGTLSHQCSICVFGEYQVSTFFVMTSGLLSVVVDKFLDIPGFISGNLEE